MEKICVYTCITGDYDDLCEIEKKETGIDYYCFTNNKKIKSNTWEIIYIDNDNLDNQRLSRKIKILGHPIVNDNYDICVWMDACVEFKKSIKEFVKTYLPADYSFAAFKHSVRDCIYEEAKACVMLRKDNKEIIKKLMQYYRDNNYPEHYGLYEMTVFIRRNNDSIVKKTMNMWFDMVCKWSKRDQLSFMWCVYNTNMKISLIDQNVWDNQWFVWHGHNKSKNIDYYRIYFKDERQDFNWDNDIQDKYIKNGKDTLEADVTVPNNSNEFEFEFELPFGIIIKSIELKNVQNYRQEFNNISINGEDIILSDSSKLFVKSNFKKNQMIKVIVTYSKVDDNYLVNALLNNTRIINDLQNYNKVLSNEINKILNSKSWKVTKPLRKISEMQKKINK